ncbi:hypothetical protein HKX48_003649 [Thoreauomyces humboldtii]|nr:hypothetical protein HKX48_003649 [Thoreauomyces humboldtii]
MPSVSPAAPSCAILHTAQSPCFSPHYRSDRQQKPSDYFSLSRGVSGQFASDLTPLQTGAPYLTPVAIIADTPYDFFTPALGPTSPGLPRQPVGTGNRTGRLLTPQPLALGRLTGTSASRPLNTPPPPLGSAVPTPRAVPASPMHLTLPSPVPAAKAELSAAIPRNLANPGPRPASFAGGSISTPSSPELLNFQPEQYADLLRAGIPHSVLGLDMRSYQHYSQHRVSSSVNVSIPTTLLKRPAFTPVKMFGSLSSEYAKNVLKDWTSYENVVVYDNDSAVAPSASPIKLLVTKLQHANPPARIGWLVGGFQAFAAQFGDLCDMSPPPAGSEGMGPAASATAKGISLVDLAGPMTAPSALGALGAARPSLQPTYAAHTSVSNLNSDDRMLLDTVEGEHPAMPLFLKELVQSGNVRAQIERNFSLVEAAEKKRVDCAFRARSRTDPFSVSDALEGGTTRNRYNNIWPFNHNRVKLGHSDIVTPDSPNACSAEQQTATNDYINASHIISPAGHRRYIATQGPIGSTFDDFWRMAWEQRSRVILMLVADADVQQGSQTCHKYWPDRATSFQYGRVQVSHVQEFRVPFQTEMDPNAGGGVMLREFRVIVDSDTDRARTIWQVQYLGWPDHGVPKHADEMLQVHNLVSKLCSRLDAAFGPEDVGPVVVHCSAGCGRTGAFICIDAVFSVLTSQGCIKMASTNSSPPLYSGLVSFDPAVAARGLEISAFAVQRLPTTPGADTWSTVRPILTPNTFAPQTSPHDMILATVHHLRSQRVLMVQSLSQYGFCYEVIARACAIGATEYDKVACSTVVEKVLQQFAMGPDHVDGINAKRGRGVSLEALALAQDEARGSKSRS